MCPSMCRALRSWLFWAQGDRRAGSREDSSLPLPPPPPSTCPPPPTSLIMRGRKRANTLSSPNSRCTTAVPRGGGWVDGGWWWLWWRGKKKKKESGAKCERGLVSMPTGGGRTYAASQAAMVPARHLFLSLLFSLPACPPLPSPLSVGEIRLGPAPRIKPYLSSWG